MKKLIISLMLVNSLLLATDSQDKTAIKAKVVGFSIALAGFSAPKGIDLFTAIWQHHTFPSSLKTLVADQEKHEADWKQPKSIEQMVKISYAKASNELKLKDAIKHNLALQAADSKYKKLWVHFDKASRTPTAAKATSKMIGLGGVIMLLNAEYSTHQKNK